MKKEVPIIITILHGETCGLSYSAIDVDSSANNIPQTIKDADMLTFVPAIVEYNKMATVPAVVIHGYFEQDKTIQVKFIYNINNELFNKITKFFVSNQPIKDQKDSHATVTLIKELMDKYDPMITMQFNEK